ncbi:hypothetical protein [Desulfosarcina cetonica]|uniref:hypothetical protein n=1 Tax=Desulfosarcina cetonica TaxID=90730 RepID=UPI0012EDB9ED|nr:hypothetical protein [Desulfosarcina cetonica]
MATFDAVDAWRLKATRPAPDPEPQAQHQSEAQAYRESLSENPADDLRVDATLFQSKKKFPWLFLLLLLVGLLLLLFLLPRVFGLLGSDRNHNASPSNPLSPPATAPNGQNGRTSQAQGHGANGMSEGHDPSAVQSSSSPNPTGVQEDGGNSLPQTGLPNNPSVSAGANQGREERMQEFLGQDNPNDFKVPQDAIMHDDLSFLQGEWISITNLVSSVSKENVVIHYRFDAQGNGTTTIIQDRTKRCTAPVKAWFKGADRLYIEDQADVICSSTAYFPKSTVSAILTGEEMPCVMVSKVKICTMFLLGVAEMTKTVLVSVYRAL